MLKHIAVALVVASSCAAGQERAELPIEQEIEALIAKTNALESFHLVYDLSRDGEETHVGCMDIVYRAPDLGRVRVTQPGEVTEAWFTQRAMYLLSKTSWRRTSLEPLAARRILDERFPGEARPLAAGVFLSMTMSTKGLNLSFGSESGGRSYVLGWLEKLRKGGEVTREGGALAWHSGDSRYRVSRETGLLEFAEAEVGSVRTTLSLQKGEVNVALAPEATTLPEAARSAALDDDMTRSLLYGNAAALREAGFARAYARQPWDESARADSRAFLEALYRELLERQHSEQRQQLLERIEQVTERARSLLQQDDSAESRAKIQENAARMRADFVDLLARGEKAALESLPLLPSMRFEARQEMLDIEREVITTLWDELLRKPTLASFDEKLAAALGK